MSPARIVNIKGDNLFKARGYVDVVLILVCNYIHAVVQQSAAPTVA